MSKIKETITALTSGDFPGGVRVSREEREPMSDARFKLIINSLTKVGLAHAAVSLLADFDTGTSAFVLIISLGLFAFIYIAKSCLD